MKRSSLILLLLLFIDGIAVAYPNREKADSLFHRIELSGSNREKCRAGCEAFSFMTLHYRDSTLLDSIYHILLTNQFNAANNSDSLLMADVLSTMAHYKYIIRDFENSVIYF